jgi:hypothetical protein
MKEHVPFHQSVIVLTAFLGLLLPAPRVVGEVVLSNLETVWTGGGIGDIHGLFPGGPPYGSMTARFTTGSGTAFSLNAMTLEFYGVPPSPQWAYMSLQVFRDGDQSPVGSLGNPAANPRPTQWPGATTLIDFTPATTISLQPLTGYSLVLDAFPTSPTGALLLFAHSPVFTTPTDWAMHPTLYGNPYAQGQFLKLAVDVTPVPEPAAAVLLLAGGLGAWAWSRRGLCPRSTISHLPSPIR